MLCQIETRLIHVIKYFKMRSAAASISLLCLGLLFRTSSAISVPIDFHANKLVREPHTVFLAKSPVTLMSTLTVKLHADHQTDRSDQLSLTLGIFDHDGFDQYWQDGKYVCLDKFNRAISVVSFTIDLAQRQPVYYLNKA